MSVPSHSLTTLTPMSPWSLQSSLVPDLRDKLHWVATRMPRTYAGLLLKRDWDELFKEEAG